MTSRFLAPAIVVIVVAIGACIPLLFNRTYYFVDYSQVGAFGQWYKIGERVLTNDWSLVNPLVWQSGNYVVSDGWGIFSPILWLIGVASHFVPSALLFTTGVKIACLLVGGLGVYALARTFGVTRPWSTVIGAAAPLSGFTLYMDAPSWVDGLMAWSLVPLAWMLLRRAVFGARSPVLAILACTSVIGVNYVPATLVLAVVLAATIVEAWFARQAPARARAWGAAIISALFAVVVCLPWLVTLAAIGGFGGIGDSGLLTVDLSGLAASSVPVGTPQVTLTTQIFPDAPILYIAWFLPLLAYVDWHQLAARLRERLSIVIVLAFSLLAVLLPSDFGPLRFPARMMPYAALTVLLVAAVALSGARPGTITRRRFLFSALSVVVGAGIAIGQGPQFFLSIAAVSVASLVGTWLVYRILGPGLRIRNFRPMTLVAGLSIVATLGFLVAQHDTSPRSPLPDYDIPSHVADYQSQVRGASGDVIVVGSVAATDRHPDTWRETLVGNLWYLNDAHVQNAYASVVYPGYESAACQDSTGFTCPGLYSRLFAVQPHTGETLVDLMGVSTIQIIKSAFADDSWSEAPRGWEIVQDTARTRLIARDRPIPGAGGLAWSSSGTKVTTLHTDAMGMSFRVENVPAGGGEVALSRIPWPGYRVTGAELEAKPLDGFLMGVKLTQASIGKVVSVSYWSPGWQAQVIAAALAAVLLLGWVVLRAFGLSGAGRTRIRRWARLTRVTSDPIE